MTMPTTSTAPLHIASAMPKDTAKRMRPTASSRATMGSSRSVSLPLALYWRTTISVAAGAVAAAIAPRVMAAGTESTSGRIRWKSSRAASTSSVAATACRMPMTSACLPVSRSWERRNSLPMEKAMKPKATLEISLSPSSSSKLPKPSPGMCSRPRQQGPISTPAIRYAVTSGRWKRLSGRVISSPANMATERDRSSVISIKHLFFQPPHCTPAPRKKQEKTCGTFTESSTSFWLSCQAPIRPRLPPYCRRGHGGSAVRRP